MSKKFLEKMFSSQIFDILRVILNGGQNVENAFFKCLETFIFQRFHDIAFF